MKLVQTDGTLVVRTEYTSIFRCKFSTKMVYQRDFLKIKVRPGNLFSVLSRHSSTLPSSSSGRVWLLPIAAIGYYGYRRWTDPIKDTWEKHRAISDGSLDPPRTAFKGEILLYKLLPLRAISRIWGFLNDLDLPVALRRPLLGLYVGAFGCNMEEAAVEDLREYPNLGSLFRRALKARSRPIDGSALIVSPSDGRVVHFGKVQEGSLEQVKGVSYSLDGFLGIDERNDQEEKNGSDSLLKNPVENCLFHCVLYLAPGDYHRYHSPANWRVERRRHFPGDLFSVSPGVTRWLKGLFNYNERVVYSGSWEHGFFCFAPVGATNVGSIKAYFDPELATNLSRRMRKTKSFPKEKIFSSPIDLKKGDPIGEFNLGSSIVLIFEAPKNFKFDVVAGQKIQYGSYVGRLERVSDIIIPTPVIKPPEENDAKPVECWCEECPVQRTEEIPQLV